MDKVDIIIIGAGVVGLAIAEKLSGTGKDILVLEKHDSFGRETSSRNSEVIHAGLYNPKSTLKTELCIRGRNLLYELCDKNGIQYNKTGKIIIAITEDEIEKVYNLKEKGINNGVEGLTMLNQKEVNKMEPDVFCKLGLYCPVSGIIDTHGLMKYFEQEAEKNGVTQVYNCEVINVSKSNGSYTIVINDTDGEKMELQTDIVINSAGLSSDKIAELAGINIDKNDYRLSYCKGEYFSVSNKHRGKIKKLIYPVPTPISLGTHVVLSLDKRLRLGPNAFYINEIDYDVDISHKEEIFKDTKNFLPFIDLDDIQPDMAGIRPKLQKPGEEFRDFIIKEESELGFPGLVNLIGIESPGFTSCAAIAELVENLVKELF